MGVAVAFSVDGPGEDSLMFMAASPFSLPWPALDLSPLFSKSVNFCLILFPSLLLLPQLPSLVY